MLLISKLLPALVITRREVRDQFRDWRIIFPIVGLTMFFPFLMNFTAQQILGFVRQYGASILGDRLVPFLLMIVGFFPISVSLVIALESFVGEKERGSIEPLLNTPLTDWQLYLGKLLAATVPPLISSYIGMTVYLIGLKVSGLIIPDFDLLILIVVLTSVQAIMMVSGAVVVSTQATSVRAANLLASFIIIPVALLIQMESIVMFWGNYTTLWWVVLGLFVITFLFIRIGLAHFQREELLGREIDILNIRLGWRIFRKEFTDGAISLRDWFFRCLPGSLIRLKKELIITTILGLIGFVIGILLNSQYPLSITSIDPNGSGTGFQKIINMWGDFSFTPVFAIFWQNFRVMLLAFVLGILTIGVLGPIPLMASLGVAGYLCGLLLSNGFTVISFLGIILPHGIFEIPAAIISSAAVLHIGLILATPNRIKTIGEVWLESIAVWTKILIGIVVPVLLLAACIESWITPRIATLLFP